MKTNSKQQILHTLFSFLLYLASVQTVFIAISAPGPYKIIQADKTQIPHQYLSLPGFKSSF